MKEEKKKEKKQKQKQKRKRIPGNQATSTEYGVLDSEIASWLATSIMRARRCETGLLKSYFSHVTYIVVCS
jgi:hypothetical protein